MSAGWRGAGGPDGDAAGLLQERLHFQDVRYFAWSDKQVQAHVMQLEKELHAMAKSPVVSLHALAGDVQESARSLAPSEVRARLSGLLSKIAGASSRAAQGVDERVEAAIAPLPEQATVLRRTGQALEAADRRAMGAASARLGGFATALAGASAERGSGAARLQALERGVAQLSAEAGHTHGEFAGWVQRSLASPALQRRIKAQEGFARQALAEFAGAKDRAIARIVARVDRTLYVGKAQLAYDKRVVGQMIDGPARAVAAIERRAAREELEDKGLQREEERLAAEENRAGMPLSKDADKDAIAVAAMRRALQRVVNRELQQESPCAQEEGAVTEMRAAVTAVEQRRKEALQEVAAAESGVHAARSRAEENEADMRIALYRLHDPVAQALTERKLASAKAWLEAALQLDEKYDARKAVWDKEERGIAAERSTLAHIMASRAVAVAGRAGGGSSPAEQEAGAREVLARLHAEGGATGAAAAAVAGQLLVAEKEGRSDGGARWVLGEILHTLDKDEAALKAREALAGRNYAEHRAEAQNATADARRYAADRARWQAAVQAGLDQRAPLAAAIADAEAVAKEVKARSDETVQQLDAMLNATAAPDLRRAEGVLAACRAKRGAGDQAAVAAEHPRGLRELMRFASEQLPALAGAPHKGAAGEAAGAPASGAPASGMAQRAVKRRTSRAAPPKGKAPEGPPPEVPPAAAAAAAAAGPVSVGPKPGAH